MMALPPTPASAANVILDGAGGSGGRTTHAIGPKTAAVRYATRLRVFAYDRTTGDLRWGRQTTTGWRFARLDGSGGTAGRIDANVGEDQAAVVYAGQLHVFYYDRTHGDLRHGRYDGSSWSFETLDGAGGGDGRVTANVGLRVSAAPYGQVLHVVYANTSSADVRLASLDGTSWSFETLDGAGGADGRILGNVGWHTAMATYGSTLHAFYFWQDPTCDPDCHLFGTIREASFDGDAWTFTTVDDINCCFADQSLAVAIRSPMDVYLLFQNFGFTTLNLRAKRWNGSAWENVGCVGEPFVQFDAVGNHASAAVIGGVVRVTYFDAYSGTFDASGVVHTSFDGSTWRTALVGIQVGAPAASVAATGPKVFVGAARIGDPGTSNNDLVLATPRKGGTVMPPDDTCT
jgi:hypothetical protein